MSLLAFADELGTEGVLGCSAEKKRKYTALTIRSFKPDVRSSPSEACTKVARDTGPHLSQMLIPHFFFTGSDRHSDEYTTKDAKLPPAHKGASVSTGDIAVFR